MAHSDDAQPPQGIALVQHFIEKARQAIGRLPGAALGLAFPQSCVACGCEFEREPTSGDAPFCARCLAELAPSAGLACPRCAMPLPVTQEMPTADELPEDTTVAWSRKRRRECFRCCGRRYWFHSAIAAGRYSGPMRELVLRMKRGEHDWISLSMGQLIWHSCREKLTEAGANLVVPVPLHWRRRFRHGTNSAALVAEVLARRLGLPMASRLLRRHRNTRPQFSLSPTERRANVRGAFTVRAGYSIEKARVLLVDDIMTSGATANEAARSLRKAGAEYVCVVVAARAVTPL